MPSKPLSDKEVAAYREWCANIHSDDGLARLRGASQPEVIGVADLTAAKALRLLDEVERSRALLKRIQQRACGDPVLIREIDALVAGDSAPTPAKAWVACSGDDYDDEHPVAVYLDKDAVNAIEKAQADAMSAWTTRNDAWQAECRNAERSEQRPGGAAHNEQWRKEHPWEPPPKQLWFHRGPVKTL